MPGAVFAENYDTGGQGVAYNVTSVNGTANGYRSDGVDLEATTDTGGPANNLGWTAAGQWFKYTVNVARRHLHHRPAAGRAHCGDRRPAHRQQRRHQPERQRRAAPATGGYQTWTTVVATVTLTAGTQTLTVDQDSGGWNINSSPSA